MIVTKKNELLKKDIFFFSFFSSFLWVRFFQSKIPIINFHVNQLIILPILSLTSVPSSDTMAQKTIFKNSSATSLQISHLTQGTRQDEHRWRQFQQEPSIHGASYGRVYTTWGDGEV